MSRLVLAIKTAVMLATTVMMLLMMMTTTMGYIRDGDDDDDGNDHIHFDCTVIGNGRNGDGSTEMM